MRTWVNALGRPWLSALAFIALLLTLGAARTGQAAGQESQTSAPLATPPSAPARPSATPGSATAPAAAIDLDDGKRLFVENCSPCHGVNGGGEDGPDLHGVPARLSDQEVQGIIRRGIPGTAMPGASTLSDRQAANVAAYLRKLGGPAGSGKQAGDPAQGEALYNSSGCSNCHMIAGQGGSIGPELSRIGAMRGAAGLKARLQNPGANLPQMEEGLFGSRWMQYLMFRAVEKDGRVVEGMRVGEDSFTIILKDASGKFHGLWKPDLRSLEKEPGKSFMPSFQGTLSVAQIDDVVAYLSSLKGAR